MVREKDRCVLLVTYFLSCAQHGPHLESGPQGHLRTVPWKHLLITGYVPGGFWTPHGAPDWAHALCWAWFAFFFLNVDPPLVTETGILLGPEVA